MCPGNRAAATTTWVNEQLATLWKLSVDCAEKHGVGLKPSNPDIAHSTCLAHLCVGKHRLKPAREDLLFFSTFEAPKIQFICNHDILLRLRLKSGHFRLDNRSKCEQFAEYTCAFRVPFRQHLITDTTLSNCGQSDVCKAKFLILDLTAAEVIREHCGFAHGHKWGYEEVDRKHKIIVKYLQNEYLPLLRRGGLHFIQSLPDFDILSRSHQIDWSSITEYDVETTSVFGVNVEIINTFLRSRWLESASCVDELHDGHDHSRYGEFALAEHRASCDNFHFHAFFGPPQVRALCHKEVILFLDIQDVHFYMGGGFKGEPDHRFNHWKIAFVAEVKFVEEDEGNVRRLRLNFSHARHCDKLSIWEKLDITDVEICRLRSAFIRYISNRYLSILEEFEHDHIYRLDVRVTEIEEYIEEEEEIDIEFFSEDEFKERLCITETFGFDLITTVTQASINCHLRSIWNAHEQSCLTGWSYDSNFAAAFGPLQIQLQLDSGSNAVIVYLTLREGALAILSSNKKSIGGEMHEFSNWRVAFEVKVKLREYTKEHVISDCCLREKKAVGDYVNRQLVLDFASAKFRQDLSRLPGLFDDCHYRLARAKRQALVHYITRYYFNELIINGHHVLYTFPVWKAGSSCGFNRFAPTAFSFQFYGGSKEAVSCLFGRQRSQGNRNMIVICGMVDGRRRPAFPLPSCNWTWCSSQDIFAGTMCLSRSVFLEGWLLRELARVNCRTTLVPLFEGIGDSGEWKFDLVVLEGHEWAKSKPCDWVSIPGRVANELAFEHRNKEVWTYDHTGDSCDIHNGGYHFFCETENMLTIPTSSKHGCSIRLTGKVTLKMRFKGGQKSWSTSAVAKWYATIHIIGGAVGCGPRIEVEKDFEISEESGFMGDFDIVHPRIKDAPTLLNTHLGKTVFIEEQLLVQLRETFCDVWPLFYSGAYGYTLCNPVFTSCGDLSFDLQAPIDCSGRCFVPERRDICLPTKHHSHYIRPAIFEHEYFGVEYPGKITHEASYSTTATAVEGRIIDERSDDQLAHKNGKLESEYSETGSQFEIERRRTPSYDAKGYKSSERWHVETGRAKLVGH